ncbi:uncharacterized protein crybg2 isoform X3 [Brienomyrus brachyistius]|uniref:uncharacterized protein crybg2 isoform X3 n=1 Tax=Brienomyrus brachyistius TaxID=42636 RepID=UPI0020B3323D|nr:uncharacterized protein crybg2 isoform X3 [Brienomyrus brachyistius]
MAGKSPFARKSLKSLFSKSEANLASSGEKDSGGKSFKLFKWKKKKYASHADDADEENAGVSSPGEPDTSEDVLDRPNIHHDAAASVYSMDPRSKKESLSSSETDLRKKKFHTFSFGWKKKKKKSQLSPGLSQSVAELDACKPSFQEREREECSGEPGDQSKRFRFSASSPPGEQLPKLSLEAQEWSEILEDPFSTRSTEDGFAGMWHPQPSCLFSAECDEQDAVFPDADPSGHADKHPSSNVCPQATFEADVGRPVIPTPDSVFSVIAPSVYVLSDPDLNPAASYPSHSLCDDTNSVQTDFYHPTHFESQPVQSQMGLSASLFDTQPSVCDRYSYTHSDTDFTEPNNDRLLTDTNKSLSDDTVPTLTKIESSLYNRDPTISVMDSALCSDIASSVLSSSFSNIENSSSLIRTDLLQPSHNSVSSALDITASFSNVSCFLSNADSGLTHSDHAEITVDSTINPKAGYSLDTCDTFLETVPTESHTDTWLTGLFTTNDESTPRNDTNSVGTNHEAPGLYLSSRSEPPADAAPRFLSAESSATLLPTSDISDPVTLKKNILSTSDFHSLSQCVALSTLTSIYHYKPGLDQEMGETGESQGTRVKIEEVVVSMEQKEKEPWREGQEVRMNDLEPEVKMEDQGQWRNHQEVELRIGGIWAEGIAGAKEMEGGMENQEVRMEDNDLGARCQEQDAKPRMLDHGTGTKMEVLGAMMGREGAAEPMSSGHQEMEAIMREQKGELGKGDKQLTFQIAGQEQQLILAGDVKEAWKPDRTDDSHGTWKVTKVAGIVSAVFPGSEELCEEDQKKEDSSIHMCDENLEGGKEEMERGYGRGEWVGEKKHREMEENVEQKGPQWGFGESKQQRFISIGGEGLQWPFQSVLKPDVPVCQVQASEECLAATPTQGHEEKGAGLGTSAPALLETEKQPGDQTESQCRNPRSGETDDSTGAAAGAERTLTVAWREANTLILQDSVARPETAGDSEEGREAVTYSEARRRAGSTERADGLSKDPEGVSIGLAAVQRADTEALPGASAASQAPETTHAAFHTERLERSGEKRGSSSHEQSLVIVGFHSAAPQQPVSESAGPQTFPGWDGAMNSGVTILSTTLSMRPAPAQHAQGEWKQRFHKVSLVDASERLDPSQELDGTDRLQTAPSLSSAYQRDPDHLQRDSDYKEDRLQRDSDYKEARLQRDSDYKEARLQRDSDYKEAHLQQDSDYKEARLQRDSDYKEARLQPKPDQKETRLQVHYVEETFVSDPDAPESSISSMPFSLSRYSPVESLSHRMFQESPMTIDSGETPSFLGNSIWLSEVQRDRRDWVEPTALVGDAVREQSINTGLDTQVYSDDDHTLPREEDLFSGVFRAMRVELPPSPTNPTVPDSDVPNDMHAQVDTLKSLDCPPRHRAPRPLPLAAFSSLPPIREDTHSPDHKPELEMLYSSLNPTPDSGLSRSSPVERYTPLEMMNRKPEVEMLYRSLSPPPDSGLSRSSPAERYTPLEMMNRKPEVSPPGQRSRSLSLPFLETLQSSRQTQMNGVSMAGSSRLDGSLLFSSYLADRSTENGPASTHRSLLRTASMPEGATTTRDPVISGHLSFLMTPPSSLLGPEYGSTTLMMGLPATSPGELTHTPSSPLDLFPRANPPPSQLNVQRTLSSNGSILSSNEPQHVSPVSSTTEPDKNVVLKYRAFPDAYLTKAKEHGKLNPRPGKMLIYNQPGFCGNAIEVRADIIDCTPWQLPESISIQVVRGGWVLYEKPNFMGEKIALEEGDIELTCPFGKSAEGQEKRQENGERNGEKSGEKNGEENGQENGEEAGDKGEQIENAPAEKAFIVGSLRRAVRDYSVPEICLYPEENAEGKKVIFRDTSPDARIFGCPIKASSIIINAGLWLVYPKPFFTGIPRVLEVGGYPDPTAWGVKEPYVSSLQPLKIGEPRVEFPNDPKLVIYEKPYFTGKSREIYTNMRDFITRVDVNQNTFMYNVGSVKVLGGCWVAYEKEGFRGHQYFLEEGEYHDWRVWGGCDAELRSVRLIRADLSEPMLELLALPVEDQLATEGDQTLEVVEAIPDVELVGFRTSTKSIDVLSGAWIAYSHVDFSGHQYILEKGFYSCCSDWGSEDNRICSLQPILQVPNGKVSFKNEVMLYSEPNFQGTCRICMQNLEVLPETIKIMSCRVQGGSWAFYEDHKYLGNTYVLSEGDYPNLTSMGCPPKCSLGSLKSIPMIFTVPSISFFGMESFAGREFTIETEVLNLLGEGVNNHTLSVKVNRGCWVLCEYSNYRGRQVFLETTEIPNWPKFSNLPTIGSLYPVRQKRCCFRIRNKERGHYLSVQGNVEENKSGRVVVTEEVEGFSDIWFYQDGMLKNKIAPSMSLQVMGNMEAGARVMLWAMTRMPIQTWSACMAGPIASLTFPDLLLDVKGGKTYDRDHVVVLEPGEDRTSQQWELELL